MTDIPWTAMIDSVMQTSIDARPWLTKANKIARNSSTAPKRKVRACPMRSASRLQSGAVNNSDNDGLNAT